MIDQNYNPVILFIAGLENAVKYSCKINLKYISKGITEIWENNPTMRTDSGCFSNEFARTVIDEYHVQGIVMEKKYMKMISEFRQYFDGPILVVYKGKSPESVKSIAFIQEDADLGYWLDNEFRLRQ
jgi:hypothetical protein